MARIRVCGKCSGSSPAVETEAVEELWKRPGNRSSQCIALLSHGVSNRFLHLQTLNVPVCDDMLPVIKDDCVNHTTKRLRTGLRYDLKEWRRNKMVENTVLSVVCKKKNSEDRRTNNVARIGKSEKKNRWYW
jgi:hypothetical protein